MGDPFKCGASSPAAVLLQSLGPRAAFAAADVTSEAEVEAALDTARVAFEPRPCGTAADAAHQRGLDRHSVSGPTPFFVLVVTVWRQSLFIVRTPSKMAHRQPDDRNPPHRCKSFESSYDPYVKIPWGATPNRQNQMLGISFTAKAR